MSTINPEGGARKTLSGSRVTAVLAVAGVIAVGFAIYGVVHPSAPRPAPTPPAPLEAKVVVSRVNFTPGHQGTLPGLGMAGDEFAHGTDSNPTGASHTYRL